MGLEKFKEVERLLGQHDLLAKQLVELTSADEGSISGAFVEEAASFLGLEGFEVKRSAESVSASYGTTRVDIAPTKAGVMEISAVEIRDSRMKDQIWRVRAVTREPGKVFTRTAEPRSQVEQLRLDVAELQESVLNHSAPKYAIQLLKSKGGRQPLNGQIVGNIKEAIEEILNNP